jgi:copper oxidase (laccase) domain-containing protein
VAAACHAGWRGAAARITVDTVSTMENCGAELDELRTHVSPCISLEAFEVGPEVAARFDDAVVHRRDGWDRPHVDLKAVLRGQLEEAGVPVDAIGVSEHSTARETDDFFSHRASGGTTGRMFGAIVLRN